MLIKERKSATGCQRDKIRRTKTKNRKFNWIISVHHFITIVHSIRLSNCCIVCSISQSVSQCVTLLIGSVSFRQHYLFIAVWSKNENYWQINQQVEHLHSHILFIGQWPMLSMWIHQRQRNVIERCYMFSKIVCMRMCWSTDMTVCQIFFFRADALIYFFTFVFLQQTELTTR